MDPVLALLEGETVKLLFFFFITFQRTPSDYILINKTFNLISHYRNGGRISKICKKSFLKFNRQSMSLSRNIYNLFSAINPCISSCSDIVKNKPHFDQGHQNSKIENFSFITLALFLISGKTLCGKTQPIRYCLIY